MSIALGVRRTGSASRDSSREAASSRSKARHGRGPEASRLEPREARPGAARLRIPWITLGWVLGCLGVAAVPALAPALELQRETAFTQCWRVLGCHLTHFSSDHLAWNLGSFALLGSLAEQRSRRRLALLLGLACIAIPAAVLWTQPELTVYRGASGVARGLAALVLLDLFAIARRSRSRVGIALAIGWSLLLVIRLAHEFTVGEAVFVDAASAGFESVPIAHVVGLLCGLVAVGMTDPQRAPRLPLSKSSSSRTWT